MSAYSYDFGINIARGFVGELARTTLSVTALVGSVYALMDADTDLVDSMKRNQASFGGYVNALKMMQFTADKIASGKAPFDQEDIMQGARSLQRAGLNVAKNFDFVSKVADGIGSTFTDVAEMLRTGNFSALAEAGIITDRMAISMERWGYTATQASQKVLSILKTAESKNMFENSIRSIPQIMLRFKQIGKEFMRAIVGDPRDPNGFMTGFKKSLTEVADMMYRSLDKIRKAGAMIGSFLRFVVEVTFDFLKRVGRNVAGIFKMNDDFFKNFGERLRSFQLYLAITRAQINYFFDKYGEDIKKFLKVLGGLWAVKKIADMLVFSLNFLAGFFEVIFLTPAGWIALAIAGIALLIYNWDNLRMTVDKWYNSTAAKITKWLPIIGLVVRSGQLLMKNWVAIKTVFSNVIAYVHNKLEDWHIRISKTFGFIKQNFHAFVNAILPGWISPVIDAIVGIFDWAWSKIKGFFDWIEEKWQSLTGWFNKLAGITEQAAKQSASDLAATNARLGTSATVYKAENLQQNVVADAKKQIDGGASKSEVQTLIKDKNLSANDIAGIMSYYDSKNGVPSASTSKASFATISPDDMVAASQKVINVQRGAITINAGGMAPSQIEAMIRKILNEPNKSYR